MKTIIAVLIITFISWVVYEFLQVYFVFSDATYKAKLSIIGQLLSGENFDITLVNHKNKKLFISGLNIELLKNDSYMGGFKPVDVNLIKGDNKLSLEFADGTKFISIGADYALNKLTGYKFRFSGFYRGFIPFKISIDANKFI